MEVHKPKSWPAWRIVLTDFVIVVLRVGVAMAAQQAVEWWHWQNEVGAARMTIRVEIVLIVAFYNMLVAIAPGAELPERHHWQCGAAAPRRGPAGDQAYGPDTGADRGALQPGIESDQDLTPEERMTAFGAKWTLG